MSLQDRPGREPMVNLPAVVTLAVVVMAAIHLIRAFIPEDWDYEVLGLFAFAPDRYFPIAGDPEPWPGGIAAAIWSPFTYALLHNDMLHLVTNCTVFAALGNLLARRMSAMRFLAFCAVTSALAAVGELVIAVYQSAPVIGVSGVVSAMMGSLPRFLFQPPVARSHVDAHETDAMGEGVEETARVSARRIEPWEPQVSLGPSVVPLGQALRQPRTIQFIAAFALMNLALVVLAPALIGGGAGVAWMVHVAGFLAGLLLFPLFDGWRPVCAVA